MIEIIRGGEKRCIIESMIEGRAESVWSMIRKDKEEFHYDNAVTDWDGSSHLIRIEVFMDTMLDIDDFSLEVNELIFNKENICSEDILNFLNDKYDDFDLDGYASFNGYTYNMENDLSRDFIFNMFEKDGDSYVLMQIHYGADARVGFGPLVCFRLLDVDYFMLGMSLSAYGVDSDEDYCVYDLENIADYDSEEQRWIHKESGEEILIHTPANGF